MELVLVRHGETAWNAAGRMQGQCDSPLTALGRRQAVLVGERLKHEFFLRVYASDLGRAYRTAEIIAGPPGSAVVRVAELRERNFGIFQGLTIREIQQKYPEEFERYTSGDPDYEIPGGESHRQFWERCVACLDVLGHGASGAKVLAVVHGGVLNVMIKHILGIPPGNSRPFRLYNASINRCFCTDGEWTLGTLGEIHHLEAVTAFARQVY